MTTEQGQQKQKPDIAERLQKSGDAIGNLGNKLTMGVTVPIILFVVGFFFLPVGAVLWVIGVLVAVGTFAKKK